MSDVVIFGAGKTADVVHRHLTGESPHRVVAFAVDPQYLDEPEKLGLPVVAFDQIEARFPPSACVMMVAIGYQDLNQARADRYQAAKAKGYELISHLGGDARAVEPEAVGENSFVADARSIQPGVSVGNDSFVFAGAQLGHHCTIGDHCWIASGAVVGGAATVSDCCFLGLNATVGHEVTIGERSLLGARAVVTKDAAANSVFIEKDTELFRLDSRRFMQITKMR